ncbi:MAG TPA: DUF998 domain-containing protein [Gammaproteobacteria bacterium]|nr:DUF998 domain-containing protein [Gammaproteobacteria bacterium]
MKRLLAGGAAGGCAWFLATGAAAQATHADTLATAAFSAYLRGPGSDWLQAAYYIFAVALVLLAVRMMANRRAQSLSAAALLIVVACAVTLVAYTYSPWPLPGDPSIKLRIAIHKVSAVTAFAGVTIAMFLAAPLLWRPPAQYVLLAFATILLLVELGAAFAPDFGISEYAILEKIAIAGIVLWLIAAAIRLTLDKRSPAPPPRYR